MDKKCVLLLLLAVFSVIPAFAANEEPGVSFLGELNRTQDETPDVLNYIISRQKEGELPGMLPILPEKEQDGSIQSPSALSSPNTVNVTPLHPAANQETIATASRSESWQWPIQGNVKETFSEIGNNKGVGIYGKKGEKVSASRTGIVIYVGYLSSFGRLVIIQNDSNRHYVSTYANLENIRVKRGDHVSQGESFATLGTERENQPILYFAINYDGKPVDPLRYLATPFRN